MATNIEILGVNAANATIPISCGDELKHLTPVNLDAEIIVNDILRDIFDTAVRKSDEELKKLERKDTDILDTEAGDLIDLTRNYKQEFRTILQNLKCNTHNCPPTSNASLEEQIKKVIDEIKNLETSVRLNIEQEGRGDIEIMSEDNLSLNPVDYKSGITDILTDSNDKILQEVSDEDANSEIVLQVMDLQEDDNSLINAFPSEEELEDVNLTPEDVDDNTSLNHGDRPKSSVITVRFSNEELCAGETAVTNPVPDPEPEDKLQYPEGGKKKSIGRRLWHFIRKSSKNSSVVSNRKKEAE